jgi:hypothetical protein
MYLCHAGAVVAEEKNNYCLTSATKFGRVKCPGQSVAEGLIRFFYRKGAPMKNLICKVAVILGALCVTQMAAAAVECKPHPKEQWVSEAGLKKKLENEGYKVKALKVNGNCYTMYGQDKDDKKVEVYLDTASGEPIKTIKK